MKTRKIVRLGERIPDRAVLIQRFGRAKRQRECYEFLEAKGGSCRLTDLGAPGGFARSVISGLVDKGLAVIEDDATDTVIKDSRPASSMAKDKRNSRVLVVEDEDATSFLILNALSSFTEVKLAATVAEAWQFLKTESIDALILDLILPDGDGRQILTQLRSCPETVYLPVTILSAKGSRATKLECFRLGADDFFEKPVDPPVLGAAVRRQLERTSAESSESTFDRTTGLINRAALTEHFAAAVALAVERDHPLTLAYVELDAFEALREEQGQAGLDSILQRLAHALERGTKAADIVGLWKVGEFVILLPGAGLGSARATLEKAHNRFGGDPGSEPSDPSPLSFSAGLADARQHERLDDAVLAAERGLLEVRGAGGGRIASANDLPEAVTGKVRVLLVDDDDGIATLVRHRLERNRMEVERIDDGSDAFALFEDEQRTSTFDLVVLDMKLPGIGGFELLTALREREGERRLPVIMLTSMGRESDIVRAFNLGADDYVLKPFSPVELLARIHRLLRLR